MKKQIVLVLGIVFLCSTLFGAESLKSRVQKIESNLVGIQQELEVLKAMPGTTIPPEETVDVDGSSPTLLGEVKGVTQETEISNADSATGWAASGTGCSLSLNTAMQIEGSGCIRLVIGSIDGSNTGRATFTAGPWNLSKGLTLRVWILNASSTDSIMLNMGETIYSEQGVTATVPRDGQWHLVTWDISGIAAASKDAITKFAVAGFNNLGLGGESLDVYIDRISVFGLSQVQAFLPEGIVNLFPKVYQGTYTGTASTTDPQTITIPRKGTPIAVFIHGEAGTYGRPYLWLSSMGANLAIYLGAAGTSDADVITEVGDCYFKVKGNYGNKNGVVYHFLVFWQD